MYRLHNVGVEIGTIGSRRVCRAHGCDGHELAERADGFRLNERSPGRRRDTEVGARVRHYF